VGVSQINRGNPESKLVWLANDLSGGINVSDADDVAIDSQFRELVNYDLSLKGALSKRKGWGLKGHHSYDYKAGTDPKYYGYSADRISMFLNGVRTYPHLDRSNSGSDIQAMLYSYCYYQEDYIYDQLLESNEPNFVDIRRKLFEEKKFKIFFLFGNAKTSYNGNEIDSTYYPLIKAHDADYNVGDSFYVTQMAREVTIYPIDDEHPEDDSGYDFYDISGGSVFLPTSYKKYGVFKQNVDTVNTYDRTYFTCSNNGMFAFDKVEEKLITCYESDDDDFDVYEPTALDIRKIGFNVLAKNPLRWASTKGITSKSIQGAFLTIDENKPLSTIPVTPGQEFQLNVLTTGNIGNGFDITISVEGVNDDDVKYTTTYNSSLSTDAISTYDVVFTSQHTGDVEFKIKMNSTTDPQDEYEPYYDYYTWGEPDSNAKEITNLDVSHYGILEAYSRLVLYHGNTIWFSDIDNYTYIPNYNYVSLSLSDSDELVKIKYFRSSYIIFTKEKIFKMTGTFGGSDFAISTVNEVVGCLAPESVKVVGSKMLFVSTIGLKALTSDKFLIDLENIEDIDSNISPYSKELTEYSEAFVYDDVYYLLTNQDDTTNTFQYNNVTLELPDIIKYYPSAKTYSFDMFPRDEWGYKFKIGHILDSKGQYYCVSNEAFLKLGHDYNDCGLDYSSTFKTVSTNMGYPLHQKKVKNVILKVSGGDVAQDIYVELYANGNLVNDTYMRYVSKNSDGSLVYNAIETPITRLDGAPVLFGKSIIGETTFGVLDDVVKKLRLTSKTNNISVKVRTEENCAFTILAIGYTYKLGKVKE